MELFAPSPKVENSAGNILKQSNDSVLESMVAKMEPPAEAPKAETPVAKTVSEQIVDAILPETKAETTKAEPTEKATEPVAEVKAPVEKLAPTNDVKVAAEIEEHKAYLNGTKEEAPTGESETTTTKKKEYDPELKNKLAEYENKLKEYESDSLIKAVAEFRKSGGTDINDFIKSAGLIDPKSLSIKELYSIEAKEIGFEGQELEDAVDEKLASFESLPKLDQKKIEKELREKAGKKQDERLKSFTTASSVNNEEYNKITTIASQQITEKAQALANKKWRGYLITDELSKAIQELAPSYALPVFDESGNRIIGYNTDDAIEFAIWKSADNGRKILKANFDMGETSGFEKAMKERTRVSENISTPTITPSSHKGDDVSQAVKEFSNQKTGRVSLSDGATRTHK